jgi:hypothetical protein
MFTLSLKTAAGENKPWRNAVESNPCAPIDKNVGRLYPGAELEAIADALNWRGHEGTRPSVQAARPSFPYI